MNNSMSADKGASSNSELSSTNDSSCCSYLDCVRYLYHRSPKRISNIKELLIDSFDIKGSHRYYDKSIIGNMPQTRLIQLARDKQFKKYVCPLIKRSNKPIKRLIKELEIKETSSIALKEIVQRFGYLDNAVQHKILVALFNNGKKQARRAIELMYDYSVWDDSYAPLVLQEILDDKACSKKAQKAGAYLLQTCASSAFLNEHRFCVPEYILAIKGVIDEPRVGECEKYEYLEWCVYNKSDDRRKVLYAILEEYIRKEYFLMISRKITWVPSLISLKPIQQYVGYCSKYLFDSEIIWISDSDRAIWEILNDDGNVCLGRIEYGKEDEVYQAMKQYYAIVLDFFNEKYSGFDLSLCKQYDNSQSLDSSDDDELPF